MLHSPSDERDTARGEESQKILGKGEKGEKGLYDID